MGDRDKKSLSSDDIRTTPVTRRSAFTMMGAAAVGLALEGCYRGIRGGCSDADPYDPRGRGRRCGGGGGGIRACSDRDPYDPAGRGRRC
jgi:hypothetical protein